MRVLRKDVTMLSRIGFLLGMCVLFFLIIGAAEPATQRSPTAKVLIVLAGDSTVTDSAGWGIGFAKQLGSDAQCINMSRGGRSSKSFIAEGRWKECLEIKPDYILIQFGHN